MCDYIIAYKEQSLNFHELLILNSYNSFSCAYYTLKRLKALKVAKTIILAL